MQTNENLGLNLSQNQDISAIREEYLLKRRQLIEEDKSFRFSSDIVLTEFEKKAGEVLEKLRGEIITMTFNPVIHSYTEGKKVVESSQLYKTLNRMPKGGILHLHLTASVGVDYLVDVISYGDHLWINNAKNLIRYSQTPLEDFQLLKSHRASLSDVAHFDRELKEKLILTEKDLHTKESSVIWCNFQYRFIMANDLYNYRDFFKKCFYQSMKIFAEQNLLIVEYRHIFGMLFDENNTFLTIEEEVAVIQEVYHQFRAEHPLFEVRIISCGLKVLGTTGVNVSVENTLKAKRLLPDMVTGYDLVCEEDPNETTLFFLDQIIKLKLREEAEPDLKMELYLHGGETNSTKNENLYDSLLLGVKRIGHGLAILNSPKLQKLVKKRNILIEVSPISNMVLGYTLDLRNHAAKTLMARGVQISINSDDPSFFGYDGVTLDYAYAFLAWELDIADLKKLSLNGIEHSGLSTEAKSMKYEEFHNRWEGFIRQVVSTEMKVDIKDIVLKAEEIEVHTL